MTLLEAVDSFLRFCAAFVLFVLMLIIVSVAFLVFFLWLLWGLLWMTPHERRLMLKVLFE